MTTIDLIRTAARRWYVVLLGLALTFMLIHQSSPRKVYWSSTEVTVVTPRTALQPLTLEDVPADAVPAAVILMDVVNRGHEGPRSASVDATLYGEGKRNTTEARVRDIGGQWGSQVPNPVIDIQVVADDPQEVVKRMASEVARLSAQLTGLQDTLQVVPSQRLTLQRAQVGPQVSEVTGSATRSAASSLLAGLLLTLAGVYWWERLARLRAARRRRAGLVLAA